MMPATFFINNKFISNTDLKVFNMYVCVCRGITESALREAIYQGADRMRDLKASLGVAEQCGICACHAKQVLDQTLVQKSQLQDFIPQSTCMCGTAV